MSKKKYLILGLTAMFVLNLTDIATTFWNDPTLKAEENPLFLKYKLSAFGLIILLFAFQIAYSLLFTYHAIIFKGYNFSSVKKSFKDFLTKLVWVSQPSSYTLLQKLKISAKNLLNVLGFYALWYHCVGKFNVSVHNFMLGFLSNNSTFKADLPNKKIHFYLNDNPIWNTYFGDIIINYNNLIIEDYKKIFKYHNYIDGTLLLIIMAIFFIKKYKQYLGANKYN